MLFSLGYDIIIFRDFNRKAQELIMINIDFKKTINISSAGSGCSLRLGDTDGDGRMEIILAKPAPVSDSRFFPNQVAAITVYNVDGELLWQAGNPDTDFKEPDCELPIQIYDIDKDGKNEVIAVMNGSLLILDGKNAEIKKQIPLPDPNIGGTLLIADLEGTGYAQNIILKNKYSKLWALDVNLNTLWTFEGNVGLAPISYDINGDGKEEIIAGYNVLSSDGELLWKIDCPGHSASSAVECLYNENEPVIIFYGTRILAYSKDGEFLWGIDEEASNIVVAKFRDNTENIDILSLDSMSLFSSRGGFLFQKNEIVHLPTLVTGFDDTGRVYIAGHRQEDICTTLYDGYMRSSYILPTFGKIASCDFLGDGKTQVIIYNDDTLDIYSKEVTDFSTPARPYTRQQSKKYYTTSKYNTLPVSQEYQKVVSEDFAAQNILKWAGSYSSINMYNRFAKVSRSEFVLLLATLLHLKEEFSENFADVTKDTAYYDAVGTFKALGILTCEDNLFSPESAITVSDANDILDRLSLNINFNFDEKYEISKQDMAKLILNITAE